MFLEKFSERMGKPVRTLSEEALRILMACPFPGNIRQLEHAIERAVALSSGELILADDLPPDLLDQVPPPATPVPDFEHSTSLKETMSAFEREYIARVLKQFAYKKSAAAAHLGISRKNLWEKIQRYNLGDPDVTLR
jgi:DNA-binding NtrC family response regulator